MTERARELLDEILQLPADERDGVVAELIALAAPELEDAQAAEIARRIGELRAGEARGRPADAVFDELEARARRHSA